MLGTLRASTAAMDRKTNAQLERVSVNKAEVAPGDTVTLTASMRTTTGESVIEQYPVQIPAGLPAGPIQLVVGDGTTVTGIDIRRGPAGVPTGLKQVISELNKLRKNDRLYIKVVSFQPGVVIGYQIVAAEPVLDGVLRVHPVLRRGRQIPPAAG